MFHCYGAVKSFVYMIHHNQSIMFWVIIIYIVLNSFIPPMKASREPPRLNVFQQGGQRHSKHPRRQRVARFGFCGAAMHQH